MANWCNQRYKFFQQELLDSEAETLRNYIQNVNLGVDAQHYLEICEALGSEPDENEIPPNMDDLTYEAQMALNIYQYLQDTWVGGMGSAYIGKNLATLPMLFDLFDVQEGSRTYILQFILIIDKETANNINNKIGKK